MDSSFLQFVCIYHMNRYPRNRTWMIDSGCTNCDFDGRPAIELVSDLPVVVVVSGGDC